MANPKDFCNNYSAGKKNKTLLDQSVHLRQASCSFRSIDPFKRDQKPWEVQIKTIGIDMQVNTSIPNVNVSSSTRVSQLFLAANLLVGPATGTLEQSTPSGYSRRTDTYSIQILARNSGRAVIYHWIPHWHPSDSFKLVWHCVVEYQNTLDLCKFAVTNAENKRR